MKMNSNQYKFSGSKLPCGRENPTHVKPKQERVLEAWNEQLKKYLEDQDLRYTEQRWKIAKIILQTGGHLDVLGLTEKVKEEHPEIGAATVYRTIKVLIDAGILEESLTDEAGRVIYEIHDQDHHDHIVCLDCNAIFEFNSDKIERDQKEITEKLLFTNERHHHVIYGHCLEYKKSK